jgi:hypothetical protein
MADIIDYILQYPNNAAALYDPVVGPFFNNTVVEDSDRNLINVVPLGNAQEILMFPDLTQNSAQAASGYWVMVTTSGTNTLLAANPNLQLTNDRSLMFLGQPSVTSTKLASVTHTGIVISLCNVYCSGLAIVVPKRRRKDSQPLIMP